MKYTRTAMTLHWLIALLIFVVFPLGIYMHELPLSPIKLKLYSYHKWIGITIFTLTLLRLLWRTLHQPPALPPSISRWQQTASRIAHYLLYALLIAVPVSGWLMSSAKGVQTVWFGTLPLPDMVPRDKALGELLNTVHKGLNITLLTLVVVHFLAGLKHHFVDRDGVMSRMLFTNKIKPS